MFPKDARVEVPGTEANVWGKDLGLGLRFNKSESEKQSVRPPNTYDRICGGTCCLPTLHPTSAR